MTLAVFWYPHMINNDSTNGLDYPNGTYWHHYNTPLWYKQHFKYDTGKGQVLLYAWPPLLAPCFDAHTGVPWPSP